MIDERPELARLKNDLLLRAGELFNDSWDVLEAAKNDCPQAVEPNRWARHNSRLNRIVQWLRDLEDLRLRELLLSANAVHPQPTPTAEKSANT